MNAGTETANPSSLRLVLTLAIAGLISGIAIIGIYESTLPTITANKARELREAVFKVIPGVSQMQAMVYRDGTLVVVEKPDKDEPAVYGGYDDAGEFMGYAIPAAGPGFQDTIAILYGYKPREKLVVGMEVLESRETPGLGDKIYKDLEFVAEFSALSVEPISSKAIVRIINEAQTAWATQLPPPGSEPPLQVTDTASTEAGQ
jgi:electron transport complex protein RnfG